MDVPVLAALFWIGLMLGTFQIWVCKLLHAKKLHILTGIVLGDILSFLAFNLLWGWWDVAGEGFWMEMARIPSLLWPCSPCS